MVRVRVRVGGEEEERGRRRRGGGGGGGEGEAGNSREEIRGGKGGGDSSRLWRMAGGISSQNENGGDRTYRTVQLGANFEHIEVSVGLLRGRNQTIKNVTPKRGNGNGRKQKGRETIVGECRQHHDSRKKCMYLDF